MTNGISQVSGLNDELENLNNIIEEKQYITPTDKRHDSSNVRLNISGGQCASYNCNCTYSRYGNCSYAQCSPVNGCYRQCTPYYDEYMKTSPSNISKQKKLLKELIKELIDDIHIHNK